MNAIPRCRGHRFLLFILPLLSFMAQPAWAQGRADIAGLVDRAQAGESEEVRALLPSLKRSHPDKAGVLFLEAVTEIDAEKSVELYQRIADEHRSSEWADDALYRLYQYSYAVGAYRTARSYTDRIAAEHPKSPFLSREQRAAGAAKSSSPSGAESSKSSGGPSSAASSAAGKKQETAQSDDADGTTSYAVQVGAFSRKADAEKLAAELKEKGYTAYLREKTVAGKTVQAVWLGIFPAISQAQAFARRIKEQQNIDAIVVRR